MHQTSNLEIESSSLSGHTIFKESPTMKIKIKYDGAYPNLCSGQLIIYIGRKKYEFPDYCLSSGGSAGVDHTTWDSFCTKGPWSIKEWPQEFPNELKESVTEAVNSQIPLGCCGGCI